jgi:hypothetical protein
MTLETKLAALKKGEKRDRIVLPFHGNDLYRLSWLAPETKSFSDFDELDDVSDELEGWLPIAEADGRCVMARAEAPHEVAIFYEGFQPVAPSLEAFFADALFAKGEMPPLAKLEDAVERAEAKIDAGKWKDALKIMTEALAPYKKKMPDPKRETVADDEDALGQGYLFLGLAAHECGDDELALEAYTLGQAFLEFACGRNIMVLHLDHERYAAAIAFATALLEEWERKIPLDEELEIRGRMLVAYWLSGDAKTAERLTTKWAKTAKTTKKERKMLLDVLVEAFADKDPDALKTAKRLLA